MEKNQDCFNILKIIRKKSYFNQRKFASYARKIKKKVSGLLCLV